MYKATIYPMKFGFYSIAVRRGDSGYGSKVYHSDIFLEDWYTWGTKEHAENKARKIMEKLEAKDERKRTVLAPWTVKSDEPSKNL